MVCVDADYDQVSAYKFSHNDKVLQIFLLSINYQYQTFVQTFNLTRNPGYYGHFSCPSGEDEGASYSMVSTKLLYESYHLSEVK